LLQRVAARSEPAKPLGPGDVQQHRQQRALADARRAFDHDHPSRALPRRGHRAAQRAQLAIAFHKTASIHRGERTRPEQVAWQG
jgi:hypothetical protein